MRSPGGRLDETAPSRSSLDELPAALPTALHRQAERYATLLARAYHGADRVKLVRYASEYPGFEHPVAVRQLAANVRAVAQHLVDLLDGPAPAAGVACGPRGEIVIIRA